MDISGHVTDGVTQKPLVGATVYIERSTKSTPSTEGGAFELKNIPAGNYTLIVSYIGYEPVSIPVTEQSSHRFAVELYPNEKKLDEVTIKVNSHWAEYLGLFKMFFLGNGGKQCIIKNEKSLFLDYNNTSFVLTAEASKPLIIENQLLGYRVYYELNSFAHYPGRTSYSGYTRFEEMTPANAKEEKKWKTNRENAYYGSFMHFTRTLANKQLKEEGFVVKKLAKTQTSPANHPVLDRMQGDEFKSPDTIVSMRWNGKDYAPEDTTVLSDSTRSSQKWGRKAGYNVLYPQEVAYDSILTKTIIVSNYRFAFSNSLFITYKKKRVTEDFLGLGNAYKPTFPTSILTMLKQHTFLDNHGNLAEPNAVIHEGYWATLRVADQLPDDYEPDKGRD